MLKCQSISLQFPNNNFIIQYKNIIHNKSNEYQKSSQVIPNPFLTYTISPLLSSLFFLHYLTAACHHDRCSWYEVGGVTVLHNHVSGPGVTGPHMLAVNSYLLSANLCDYIETSGHSSTGWYSYKASTCWGS